MDRLELIKLLTDLIYYSQNVNVPNSSYIKDDLLAEEIICFLEQKGIYKKD